MPCLPSSSSKPAVIDNYRLQARYQEEHNSPSNQRRIANRQVLYQNEHDAQLAVAMRVQERSEEYDLETALALSNSLMEEEAMQRMIEMSIRGNIDFNEEQAISIAQALSLSEVQGVDVDQVQVQEGKTIPQIDDDEFKNIGDVSKGVDLSDRPIVK